MIILEKHGIFYDNNIHPDDETYVFKQVNSVIPYINEQITIGKNFNLRDFFTVVEKDQDIMQIIFNSHLGHHPLSSYIKEVKQDCVPDGREDIDYIECSWVADQFNYKVFYEKHKDDKSLFPLEEEDLYQPNEDDVNEISIDINVYGWGEYSPSEEELYSEDDELPTHDSYGLEFTPLQRLAHLPIVLDENFVIYEQESVYEKSEKNNIEPVIKGKKCFTVFDIFGAILSEISFCGTPEERDEQWKDISNTVKDTKEDYDDEDSYNINEDEDYNENEDYDNYEEK